jgi:hypothetical protein
MSRLEEQAQAAEFIFTSGCLTQVNINQNPLHHHLDYGIKKIDTPLDLTDLLTLEELCFLCLNEPNETDFLIYLKPALSIQVKKIEGQDHILRKNEILYGKLYLANDFKHTKPERPHILLQNTQEKVYLDTSKRKNMKAIKFSFIILLILGVVFFSYLKKDRISTIFKSSIDSQQNMSSQKIEKQTETQQKASLDAKYEWKAPILTIDEKVIDHLYQEYGNGKAEFQKASKTVVFLNHYIYEPNMVQKEKLIKKYLCESQDEYMDDNTLKQYLALTTINEISKIYFEAAFSAFDKLKKSVDCEKLK